MRTRAEFLIKSNEDPCCPVCGAKLDKKDWVLRILKKAGGEKEIYKIERRQCTNKACGKSHRLLPDILAPYKHYEAALIEDVIDGFVCEDDIATEDCPCKATMDRWILWGKKLAVEADGWLRSAGYSVLNLTEEFLKAPVSLLIGLKEKLVNGWLAVVLRVMCNYGAHLNPSALKNHPPTLFCCHTQGCGKISPSKEGGSCHGEQRGKELAERAGAQAVPADITASGSGYG